MKKILLLIAISFRLQPNKLRGNCEYANFIPVEFRQPAPKIEFNPTIYLKKNLNEPPPF